MGRRAIIGGLVLVGGLCLWATPRARADDLLAGSGEASAVVLHTGPIGSNLRATVNYGESLADFGGTVGRAQSATADFGLYGLLMTTPLCPGEPPAVNRKELPPMAYARSGDPGADTGHRVTTARTPAASPLRAAAGDERAWATAAPEGRALTTLAEVGTANAVGVEGGRTEARAGASGRSGRESRATSEIGAVDIAGGMVRLEHLRWDAVQHTDGTGKVDRATGTFTVGRVLVRGVAVAAPPTSGGGTSLDAANTVLAPTGIHVASPRVTVKDGVVTVSPLSVDFIDSPVAKKTVGALLNALIPVRQPIGDTISNADCNAALLWEVADIGSAGLGGNGSFLFDVGGVTAGTEASRYPNPLLAPGLGIEPPIQPAAELTPRIPAAARLGAQLPTVTSLGSPGSLRSVRRLGAPRRVTSTRIPLTGRSAGILAGASGVAAAAGLAIADWASLRREAHRAA